MNYLTSGNDSVDQIGRMSIVGNVTPTNWYRTILNENGHPYFLAIAILSDIVYWHRPTEVRDEQTGMILGWKKKFTGEMFQRSYADYAAFVGESERSIMRAMAHLEKMGVIRRHKKDVSLRNNLVIKNLLFIELFPQKIYELTFGGGTPSVSVSSFEQQSDLLPETEVDSDANDMNGNNSRHELHQSATQMVSTCDMNCSDSRHELHESATQMVKTCDMNGNNLRHGLHKPATQMVMSHDMDVSNTNIITNNNTENSSYIPSINQSGNIPGSSGQTDGIDPMDEVNAYIALIKQNIEYEHHRKYDKPYEWRLFEELFDIICDVVCVKRKTVRINEEDYPYELVKAKYLKLTDEHLGYVMERIWKTNSNVTNVRSYMMTALYNAPNTMDHYYCLAVNHDRYTPVETSSE